MTQCAVTWYHGKVAVLITLVSRLDPPMMFSLSLITQIGKVFLFPDNYMGPDLFCFVQNEEMKELILLAVQAKVSLNLTSETWISALNSIISNFFYTTVMGINLYNTCHTGSSDFYRRGNGINMHHCLAQCL
jgi:hypothetical protein